MTPHILKPVALAALLLSTSLSTSVYSVDPVENQDYQPYFNSNGAVLDGNTQFNILTLLKKSELLDVRETSQTLNGLVNTLLVSQVTPDVNSFESKAQNTALGFKDQRAVNNFFGSIPELQKAFSNKLDAEGAFLVHKESAALSILMHPKTREALNLAPMSLTAALEHHVDLYKTVYAQVFETDFLNQETVDQLRNQSMLQHLASSFTFFERTNQNNNQDNSLFFQQSTAKLGDMLINLKAQRSYVAFEDAQNDPSLVTDDSFILMSDAELATAGNKDALGNILQTAPEANLVLDAGQSFVDQEGVYSLSKHQLPETLKHLTLTNARGNATTIMDHFLSWVDNLESIDCASLSNVTTIGPYFLMQSNDLVRIDFSGLGNVRIIEHSFLSYAVKLDRINHSSFGNVTKIGSTFLGGTRFDSKMLKAQILEAGKKGLFCVSSY